MPSKNAWEGNKGMEVIKWIFVVAALAGMALALVELVTEKPDAATEVVRVSGDSREVRWKGVYEAKGREWVVREAPKESHTADTAYHDSTTDVIIFSTIL